MTDNLTLAIRRAQLAKDAPPHEPKPAPRPQLLSLPPPEIEPPPVEPVATVPSRRPMEIVQRAVAKAYGISVESLIGRQRNGKIVRPRQVAMFICHEVLQATLPQIGRRFNRDHTTVLHGIRKIELMRRTDLEFEFALQKLMTDLREILA